MEYDSTNNFSIWKSYFRFTHNLIHQTPLSLLVAIKCHVHADPTSSIHVGRSIQYIQEICTRFCCALLCCGYAIIHDEFTWSIYPYSSGLLCWHWGTIDGLPQCQWSKPHDRRRCRQVDDANLDAVRLILSLPKNGMHTSATGGGGDVNCDCSLFKL